MLAKEIISCVFIFFCDECGGKSFIPCVLLVKLEAPAFKSPSDFQAAYSISNAVLVFAF
jgi:hypothetical protein